MQTIWDAGGIQEQEMATIIVNSYNKRALSRAFLSDSSNTGFRQDERTIGGVNLQTFHTDFGVVNVMLNRYIPASQVLIVSADHLRIKWLDNPGGFLRAEPLPRAGLASRAQISGEYGLQYGNELAHGKILRTATR
jgi:hypothetical protein